MFDLMSLCLQTPVLIASSPEDPYRVETSRLNTNSNFPRADGSQRSVKVLTVQVVL